MTKRNVYIIIIIIALVLGYFLGYFISKITSDNSSLQTRSEAGRGNFKDTFDDGWEAARQKLIDSDMFMAYGDVNSLNGKIKDLGNNKINFIVELLNPLDNEILKNRTAIIDKQTEIIFNRKKGGDGKDEKGKEPTNK